MITNFDEYYREPDLNSVSKEFWKMTTVSNWKKVIIDYRKIQNDFSIPNNEKDKKCKEIKDLAAARIYKKYSFEEIQIFRHEFHKIYSQLYDFFRPIWLSDKNNYGPSDDGYWDLLSSMIGCGKRYTKKCIIEPWKYFIEMAKEHKYVENFSYLLKVNKKEYTEIRSKYDPLFRDTYRYNL